MIKLLIVDDEEIIRNGIYLTGKWNEYGIEVVGLAENGLEALEMIRKSDPEIVITDVVMPTMDGIELSRLIHREFPKVKVLIISGYDEFCYARSAVEYAVCNFLLKPARMEIILEEVLKLKAEVEKENEKETTDELMKKKLKDSLPLLKEQYLNWIINNGIDDMEVAESKFEYLELSITANDFVIMALQADVQAKTINPKIAEEFYISNTMIREICCDILNAECRCTIFEDRSSKIVIIISLESGLPINENLKKIFSMGAKIQREIFEKMNITSSVGIGSPKTKVSEIPQAYREAISALDYIFFMGNNSLIYIEDVEDVSSDEFYYSEQLENEIVSSIRTCNSEKASCLIGYFFDELQIKGNKKPEYVYDAVLLLINSISRIIIGGSHIREDILVLCLGFTKDLKGKAFRTLKELKNTVQEIVSKIISEIKSNKKMRNRSLIQNAKSYINNNISKDISLFTVADAVHISPNYLSFLFREECGQSFKNYVIQVRMEQAFYLLKSTGMNCEQIADAVGYSDGRYFSQIFKKHFGMCPDSVGSKALIE